jgi:O-antigen/teichoic acid export membrane protein
MMAFAMRAGAQTLEVPPRTEAGAAPPVAHGAPATLRRRAVTGSAWTLAGYAGSQGLRLASNVVLARLLFPEAFGLMALVTLFMQGLQMFSDIGVAPALIQHPRGDEAAFRNTAWTMQAGRGLLLSLASALGAWPFAWLMGEPSLAPLVAVSGLTALLGGLNSTALATLNRSLRLGRITLWELASQCVAIAVMVVWALVHRSVWALVAGGLAASAFRMVTSHLLERGHHDRPAWDGAAAAALFRFGRWIFLSTVLTFFAAQLDKLLLGKLLSVERLGVYAIAATFAVFSTRLVKVVGGRVGFPALAEVARQRPRRLRPTLRSMRLALVATAAAVLLPMVVAGPSIIGVLYDPRYADAGWMLQLLAAGALVSAVSSSAGQALMAIGRARDIAILLGSQILFLAAAAAAGFALGGERGLVAGVAGAELLNYPLLWLCLRRHRLWQPEIDLPVLALAAGGIGWALWPACWGAPP